MTILRDSKVGSMFMIGNALFTGSVRISGAYAALCAQCNWSQAETRHLNPSTHLWCLQDHSKCTEDVIEQLLVNLWVQVSDEDVSSHVQVLRVGGSLGKHNTEGV